MLLCCLRFLLFNSTRNPYHNHETQPMRTTLFNAALIFATCILSTSALAQDDKKPAPDPAKRQVFFGEQHLHTVNSPDAFAMGTRNTPDDAYRFAKGEAIKKNTTGEMVQKKTPYDWCAVTDHAEYLGVMPLLLDPNSPLQKTPIGKLVATGKPADGEAAFQQIITSASNNKPISYMADPKVAKTAWEKQKAAANRHYEPGKFTTLIAFEWSSQPNSQNLHHNVFFRDDEGPDAVFSAFDSVKREDLWTYQEVQRSMGHENYLNLAQRECQQQYDVSSPRTSPMARPSTGSGPSVAYGHNTVLLTEIDSDKRRFRNCILRAFTER